MNLPPSRNKDIDFVKGVLIFLVVLGHSLEVFQTQDFSTNSIHTAIPYADVCVSIRFIWEK